MSLERLVFISTVQPREVQTLPKQFQKYVGQYELLEQCAQSLPLAANTLDVPIEQLEAMVRKGQSFGDVQKGEFRKLIANQVYKAITQSALPGDKRLSLLADLHTYVNSSGSAYVEISTFDTEDIPSYQTTGFEPLDTITHIPEGAFINILAQSSAGKTSTMLSMANAALAKPTIDKIVYVSLEMRASMVALRAQPLSNLTGDNAVLIAGDMSVDTLTAYVNPKTAMFIDYADLFIVPHIAEKRLKIEYVYRHLLAMAKGCAFLVNASQVKQTDTIIEITSGNEAAAKAHVPDIILGLENRGKVEHEDYNLVNLQLLKNRTGQRDKQVNYYFNYATLEVVSLCETLENTNEYLLNW